jgi:ribosomal protein L35
MDTPAEFRKHAADCEKMAKVSNDRETKAAWKRMAERWLLCAKLAEDQDEFQRHLLEEKSSKQHRRPPHHWAA